MYRNADGSRTRRVYSEPVYARRPDGSWAPIELDLAPDGAGRIAPKLAPYRVSFAASATDGNIAALALDGGHEVAFALRGAAAAPGEVSGERVGYPEVRPAADLRFGATANGLKEALVVRSAAAPATYDFELRLRGLTPALDEATGIIALSDDANGAVRAVIPAGWMRDARGAVSHGFRYRLSRSGRGWVLRVELDQVWLHDDRRAFPVTVDPSVQVNDDADDTYVTKGAPGNHSGEESLKAGNAGSGRISASYLHFSGLVSSLRNQYINGATLALYDVDSGSCAAKPVDVYAAGAPWSGATMTTWPGAPLAQHLSQRSFSYGGVGCAAANWGFLPLPANLITDWTHGTPFRGLSVRAANESDTGAFKRFAAANAGNAGVPYLDVTYAAQGAEYRADEVVLPTANREGRIKATVRNRGSATWAPGGQYKFGFIVKQGNTVVRTSPKFDVPRTVGPNGSVAMDVPMGPLTPGEYQVYLTMYDGGADFHSAYGVPDGTFGLRVVNVPPTTSFQQPGSGALVDSIRPTLYAEGIDDDNWPNTGLKYNFKLCSGTPEAPADCIESGWTNATWVPPAGRLRWSQTYYWWVQVHDNVTPGEFRGPLQLTTQVPQPEITSHLGGTPQDAPAPGLDPQVGNYGMTGTDASVATVGPDLTVTRTYNSLDPRETNAFGEGWASRLDTELAEDDDGSGNVTVTLPSGRQVRFGRNADGTYAPPLGQNLTLTYASSSGEYTLRDASGGQWVFNPCGKLRRITDPNGLAEELEYDVACPDGKPTGLRNVASGRRLNLAWTAGHVTQVTTDRPSATAQPLIWTYTYTGDRLASVCDPAPAPNCTRYDYQAGSHYRSVVMDDNPRAYWRLGETTGSVGAASVAARTAGADKGTYTGVTLGTPGAIAGATDTAAAFDGAAARVDLPAKLTSPTMTLAVELWFKTTAGGVLMSYADQPFGSATASTFYTPVLYVGQDGFLRGGFWVPEPDGQRQITSDAPVNDGRWHHAVLSGAIDTQKLYVDGTAQKDDAAPTQDDTVKGLIDHDEMPNLVVGAGKTNAWPSGNGGDYFFAGNIDEVAVYQHPLGSAAIARHAAAARQVQQLTKVTQPQDDRVAAQLTYDTAGDRVATYVDHDGRSWRLDAPSRNEAVRQVVLHGPYPDYGYEFDADHGGRLTKRTYDGKSRTYEYNTAGFRSAETDGLGHKATFTTDDRGNVLSQTTCRHQQDSCQTSYATYFLNAADPLDPRNDRKLTESDARSSGPGDTTYRTTYQYDTVGRQLSATYPKPAGATANPVETWKYSTGTESADGGGTVPAGLLVEHTGRRADQTTRYSYRSNGDLAEQTSPVGLRTRYGYDGIGRKTSEAQLRASGQEIGTSTYTYTPRSEIETVTSPAVTNPITGVRHTLLTRYGYDADGNRTQITQSDTTGGDPARTTAFAYDPHDTLVKTTFPDGKQETHEYRNAGLEERVTDRAGITWIDDYDTEGRLLRHAAGGDHVDPEDPDATALVLETRSYDAAGRLAATRDAMGRETRYTYYDDDRQATATRMGVLQADGTTRRDVLLEQREYDAAGDVTKLTTAGGRVTASTYDPGGYLATETLDPAGLNRSTTYTRAADGLPVAVDRTGSAQPGRVETIKYRYDADGQLIAEDAQAVEGDPGSVLSVTYSRDERGLVLERADRRRLPTTYTYDALGRPATETGPEVETWTGGQRQIGVTPRTTIGYNTFGESTHTKDPNGAVTTIGYNLLGQQTSIRQPDYTPPGGQVIHAETRIAYDDHGNPTATTDTLNRTTTRTYDPYGRPLTETSPEVDDQPSTTTWRYDRDGEQLSVTDPVGATTLATYDELGRRSTQTAADRKPQQAFYTARFGYDDAGNPVAVTTPAGHTTTGTFDAAGDQLTSKDPTGRTTTYGYDVVGRQVSSTDPAGVTTRDTYDLLGRPVATAQLTGSPPAEQRRWERDYDPDDNLTKVTTPEGRTTSLGYDAMNRLVHADEQAAAKTIRTTFGYDGAGNRTRFVDGNGHATDYTFTTWGLPESTIEPATAATPNAADRTWTTSYDPAGNPVLHVAPGGVTITAEYDAQDRLRVQHGSGAEAPTADKTYDYDPAGRLSGFGGPNGRTELTYDDRGNLLTSRGPAGDATFTYTADGQVASRDDASGNSTFGYDDAGRTVSVTDGLSGRTLDYRYDTAGRLAYSAERGLDPYVRRVNTHDALGRLTGDKVTEFDPTGAASRVIQGTEYGYDRDDNVTMKKNIANGVTTANAYQYDGAGRLTSWTAPSGAATTYEWDDAGNRTKAGSTTYGYDERNQLISAGSTGYTHTPRGTTATVGGRTLSFDAFDQLASDGVKYSYDSLGRIAGRDGTPFEYAGLTNDVVADGARLTSRGVAGEPIADKAADSTDTAKLLYTDQHGDVTARYRGPDAYGTRTYDPFGTVTASSGETPSIGYQDEWTEPTTGAVNMHARWYSPATGSFDSRDTWTGPQVPSAAGNRYAYGKADPIGNVDPSGHIPCSVLAFGPDCPRPPIFNLPPMGHGGGSFQGPSGGGGGGGCCSGSGSGGSGGSGHGQNHNTIRRPPPPPPPLWQRNLHNPPPRHRPGSTVPRRPPTTPSWQEGRSDLIDRSDVLADDATEITPADDYQQSNTGEVQQVDYEEDPVECPPEGTACDLWPAVDPPYHGHAEQHDYGSSCPKGEEKYCRDQKRDAFVRAVAEALGIDPEKALRLIEEHERGENGNAPWSVSLCVEVSAGAVWGGKAEGCVNFDDVGVTVSRSAKTGWFGGIAASAQANFRLNGGTPADKIGGPRGAWNTSIDAEAGLGPYGGIQFEGTIPLSTEQGSLSLDLGVGIGVEFWSHMQVKEAGNSGYLIHW